MSIIKNDLPHIVAYVLLGIAVILLAVYLGFAAFFSSHFYFHTTVGTVKCGGKTAEYVEKQNTQNAEDYLLTIYDRQENKYHLTGKDFSYEYVANGEEQEFLKKQNPFLWPACIFNQYEYQLGSSASYDKASLQKELEALDFMDTGNMEEPKDAYIKINDDGYEVIPEELGTTIIPDSVLSEVSAAVENQEDSLTLSDDCYVAPKLLAEDSIIADTADEIDAYMSAVITYNIGGADEKLTSGEILGMLNISENGDVTVDESKVDKYVQYLASTYNTYGDPRDFKTSKGDTIQVSGGDYGWVISKANEKAEILKDLDAKQPVTREPMYEQTALYPGPNDIGNTYVELDYSNQHMYYYKEGSLIFEADFVSGKLSNGNGSPDGVYKIIYKESPSVLVGETYETKVQYFVPYAYNVGFHDATWQSSFGGDRYLTHGSHGCINMYMSDVTKFYELIEKGTPVVAYYRTPVELTSESAKISNAHSYVEKSPAN